LTYKQELMKMYWSNWWWSIFKSFDQESWREFGVKLCL